MRIHDLGAVRALTSAAALAASALALVLSAPACSLDICEVATCDAGNVGGGGAGGGGESCDPACTPGANATAECVGGACVYACADGFGDCDDEPSDCEVDLRAPETCGSCERACASGDCVLLEGASTCNDPVGIAAGREHTCVLRTSGSVFCWGSNDFGVLGSGIAPEEPTPQKVSVLGAERAIRIVAGDVATCAITAAGDVRCWGAQDPGAAAQPVPDSMGATIVSVYGNDGVFLRPDGAREFQLEAPAITGPVLFATGSRVARGGSHGCAIRSAGAVHCWGSNGVGQLGLADTALTLSNPTIPIPGHTAVEIEVGEVHSCSLGSGGDIHCWGGGVDQGQVGHGQFANATSPQLVFSGADKLRAGHASTAAIVGGALHLWGRNDARQVATSASGAISTPTERLDVEGVVDVALGERHTCVIHDDGTLSCFGANDRGQLGQGNTNPVTGAVEVTLPRD